MDSMSPCYSLLNMKVIWLNMVSAPPTITMGWLNLKICQTFSLETVNTHKSEVFLLRISSEFLADILKFTILVLERNF